MRVHVRRAHETSPRIVYACSLMSPQLPALIGPALPSLPDIPARRVLARSRRVLHSSLGAFDLPSILVGVVLVGILTAGVLASVFAVIPFAQDNGAKQDLAAVRTAEGVARTKDGGFMNSAGLAVAGYLPGAASLAVGADAAGSCYVGVSRSGSGALFYGTNTIDSAQPYVAGTDTGCLDAVAQQGLVMAVGGAAQALPPIPTSPPVTGTALAAWGDNSTGQLGNGKITTAGQTTPVDVGVLNGMTITALASGYYHTCAATGTETWCWGLNASGQLGTGDSVSHTTPVKVKALTGKTITALAANDSHTCAVADGDIWCWGQNNYGQLGGGDTIRRYEPVMVKSLAGLHVTSLSLGYGHTCAVAGGDTWCWGSNSKGQLGTGDAAAQNATPVKVEALAGKVVTALSGGYYHTCAVADGDVWCWGHNSYGQLGVGYTSQQENTPVKLNSLAGKDITYIAAGSYHSCAVANGDAWCWGQNSEGQLGTGNTASHNSPVKVEALAGKTVTALNTGAYHTCAVAGEDTWCWGNNVFGQVGTGSITQRESTPVSVKALKGKSVSALVARGNVTVALLK